jgi:hypothetical protein
MANGDFMAAVQRELGAAYAKINEQERRLRGSEADGAQLRRELADLQRGMQTLGAALSQVQETGGAAVREPQNGLVGFNDQILYIDQIPGQRQPYDLVATIPIGHNVMSQQPVTTPISMDGPFVAVARSIIFQSAHTFSKVVDGRTLTYQGRSFGRFRPGHSAWDLNDAYGFQPTVGIATPGTGAPIYASPSNHSGFRSMEFDGFVEMRVESTGRVRGNRTVPTAFWTDAINSVFQLGALDFYERGDVIQFEVTPNHINNPQAGNVAEFMVGGVMPSLASQYDVQEGILDEYDEEATSDPITRACDGYIHLLLHGFKIQQPMGAVR